MLDGPKHRENVEGCPRVTYINHEGLIVRSLTAGEFMAVGILSAVRQGYHPNLRWQEHGQKAAQTWGLDKAAVGVFGEYAVSQVLDRSWIVAAASQPRKMIRWDTGYVGGGFQVRTTLGPFWPRENTDLLIHEPPTGENPKGDLPEDRFILVNLVGDLDYALVGWCTGKEGQQKAFWNINLPAPAFVVPRERLHPIRDLLPAGHPLLDMPPTTL